MTDTPETRALVETMLASGASWAEVNSALEGRQGLLPSAPEEARPPPSGRQIASPDAAASEPAVMTFEEFLRVLVHLPPDELPKLRTDLEGFDARYSFTVEDPGEPQAVVCHLAAGFTIVETARILCVSPVRVRELARVLLRARQAVARGKGGRP